MNSFETLSVIIPAFNEVGTIEEVVDIVHSVDIQKEIILVDDASTDGTCEIIESKILPKHKNIKLVKHSQNRGKGAAIRSGISKVSGDYVIIQDADLEYNPHDYPVLLRAFESSDVEVVYGSRFLANKKATHPLHYAVNQFITSLGNILYQARLTDLETCYKVFKSEVLRSLSLKSDGFEIEVEITAKLLKSNLKITEVPIRYQGRNYTQGKKITWLDGVKAVINLLKYRFTDSSISIRKSPVHR